MKPIRCRRAAHLDDSPAGCIRADPVRCPGAGAWKIERMSDASPLKPLAGVRVLEFADEDADYGDIN